MTKSEMPEPRPDEVSALAERIAELPEVEWPGGYSELGLAILDSIWSIGVNYDNHVKPLIARYRAAHPDADRHTASDLVKAIEKVGGPEDFADWPGNRQRTSTKNGILKAGAVNQAAQLLSEWDTVDRFHAALGTNNGAEIARQWKGIRGQRSGISYHYLLMLTGKPGVKADRMVIGFVARTLSRRVTAPEAVALIEHSAEKAELTATDADHRIWSYERNRRRKK